MYVYDDVVVCNILGENIRKSMWKSTLRVLDERLGAHEGMLIPGFCN